MDASERHEHQGGLDTRCEHGRSVLPAVGDDPTVPHSRCSRPPWARPHGMYPARHLRAQTLGLTSNTVTLVSPLLI